MYNTLDFVPGDGNYRFDTNLENEQFTFDVRWNTRDNAWRFDMYDSAGTLMVAGVKIVLNTYLGRKSSHPWFQVNVLVAIDTSMTYLDPGFDDIGTRVEIRHMTYSDLADELLALP